MLGLEIFGMILAISRRCHVTGLISPMPIELHLSNFQRWLSPRRRFRKCKDTVDLVVYVGGGAPQISKLTQKATFAGVVGKVYRGMDPTLGKFCRHALILMPASKVDRRCCIVPLLGGADRGTTVPMCGPSFRSIGEKFNFLWRKNRVQAGPQWKPIYMLVVGKTQRTESGNSLRYINALSESFCGVFIKRMPVLFVKQRSSISKPHFRGLKDNVCNSSLGC